MKTLKKVMKTLKEPIDMAAFHISEDTYAFDEIWNPLDIFLWEGFSLLIWNHLYLELRNDKCTL